MEIRENGELPKQHVAKFVDKKDLGTPDNWVLRSDKLLRLTGIHPLNAEPSIYELYKQGFITPISLHFVRNHGRTAKIDKFQHILSIEGLVRNELHLSMKDLEKFPLTTLPVTLCCSANRRKELNTISKTAGFNWTGAANSTNFWTGVRLSHLLDVSGVDLKAARFVHFEGDSNEKLPNGLYATSIDILTAINPFDHVLVAWKQNGVELHPDHGFPIRVIVPGFVGGRSVKWLRRIIISSNASQNFYHFHDNRIMPPFVTSETATNEGWWFREEFIYNELNVNSTIVYPSHRHRISIPSDQENVLVKGFALSGGGRKVTRVEVTLDGGNSWRLCDLEYPEELYSCATKYGRYYCWMFFQIQISIEEILQAILSDQDLRSRAWDSSNNLQPTEPTWNLLGHGNNSQSRIKMNMEKHEDQVIIQFLHSVAPGEDKTGWMSSQVKKASELFQDDPTRPTEIEPSLPSFSHSDIAKHGTSSDCWIIIDGMVYDTTNYLNSHPGGADSILLNATQDVTEAFYAIHSERAVRMLKEFHIGYIEENSNSNSRNQTDDIADNSDEFETGKIALGTSKWLEIELKKREEVNENTRLYTFSLPTPSQKLGLPVGNHVFVRAIIDGKTIIRAYTPVSSDDDFGVVVFLIKTYFSGTDNRYPEGGKMSQYFEKLRIGEKISVKGPAGHFEYVGFGKIYIQSSMKYMKKLGLICGGTGITPAYQIIKRIFREKNDTTEVYLLYANDKTNDILMHEELLLMAERKNIYVWFTVIEAGTDWRMSRGFIDQKMIEEHIPHPSRDTFIGLCGPPIMVKERCYPLLRELGHDERNITIF